jgi:hypothetical protein
MHTPLLLLRLDETTLLRAHSGLEYERLQLEQRFVV